MKNKKIIKQLLFVAECLKKPHALESLDYFIGGEYDQKTFKKENGISENEAREALKIVAKHLEHSIESIKSLNK